MEKLPPEWYSQTERFLRRNAKYLFAVGLLVIYVMFAALHREPVDERYSGFRVESSR